MDSVPKKPLLQYNENVLDDIRKKYGFDKPERFKEAVDILDKWVKEQNHFKNKDFSPRYLRNTIIPSKGSLERSKRFIDKMCTFRTLMPQYFGDYDLREDFKDIQEGITVAYLPKMTTDHYRILLAKVTGGQWHTNLIIQTIRLGLIYAEYLKEYECCDGLIVIGDYRDLDIVEHLRHVNPIDLKNGVSVFMEGVGVRIKGIHFITSSKYIELIVNLLKSVLSAKLSNRIQVHTSLVTLYDSVSKDNLPAEYGGKEKSLKEIQDKWIEELSKKENKELIRKMNASGTDESLRESNVFNEEYMGMPGSFRALSVD